MRNVFCNALVAAAANPDCIFLTGDLGYMALEPLRQVMGDRFINAGVAEQNMVSVAAGLAASGLRPWVYSIAPFLYARPFEQIRNDVGLHDLPVVMVGNGGGYAYGVMGATHHALEDYGALLTLPNLQAMIPAFDDDVPVMVDRLMRGRHPTYLRLGVSEQPKGLDIPPYSAWRQLLDGKSATLLVVGPLVGGICQAVRALPPDRRSSVWLLTELPIAEIPPAFLADLAGSGHLAVVEEHIAQGGAGQMLAHRLLLAGAAPKRFTHLFAHGYRSGRYGSQKFHRLENGLDPQAVIAAINQGAEP